MKKLFICMALLAVSACSAQTQSQRVAWDSLTYTNHAAVSADTGFLRMGK